MNWSRLNQGDHRGVNFLPPLLAGKHLCIISGNLLFVLELLSIKDEYIYFSLLIQIKLLEFLKFGLHLQFNRKQWNGILLS